MDLHLIVGARPNFIKISSIYNSINKFNSVKKKISFKIIHTGQHFDDNLSKIFFDQLKIPNPDINLNCKSSSHISQISKIMVSYESYLIQHNKPNFVIVVGDVSSTVACAIVAKSYNIEVVHIEAGIRSYDSTMPEEINRILTDSISDYAFVTTKLAEKNLIKHGFNSNKIFVVGNTMIDTLLNNIKNFEKPLLFKKEKLFKKQYFVLTLHRPSNVDDYFHLDSYLNYFDNFLNNYKIVFPIHPRTKQNLKSKKFKNIIFCDSLSYFEFNYMVANSFAVITDSGGVTEETTVLNIPCLTVRDNTERPETIDQGTNELIGTNVDQFDKYFKILFNNEWKKGIVPKYWDGYTGDRIINLLYDIYGKKRL